MLNMDSQEQPSINVINALRANHDDLQEFFNSLTEEEWKMSSACEGWRVQDVFAHVQKGTAHGIASDGLSVALAFMRDKLGL